MFLGIGSRKCVEMPPFAREHYPPRTLHNIAEQVAVIDLLLREAPGL